MCGYPLLWNIASRKVEPTSLYAQYFPKIKYLPKHKSNPQYSYPPDFCPYLLEHTVSQN
jgi:hypothetical protein